MPGFTPEPFPQRAGSREQQVWMRHAENRTKALEKLLNKFMQDSGNDNGGISSTLQKLSQQVLDVQDALNTAVAAQTDADQALSDIASTVNFLSTQVVTEGKNTADSVGPASNSGVTWLSYNSTYDCGVNVTTGPAGRLVIIGNAVLIGSALASLLGVQVVGEVGPTWTGTTAVAASDGGSGSTRVYVFNGSPNTTYTVRLRRGIDGTTTGITYWGYQTLTVIRS